MASTNFPKSYFENRLGNDPLRHKSFIAEREYLKTKTKLFDLHQPRILDIGCSTGEFYDLVFNDHNVDYYGIEPSTYASNIAKSKGITMVSSAEELTDLDCVIYRGTIQYIDSPFRSIAESAAALKPGGNIVFLATPNARSVYYFLFKTLPFLEPNFMYFIPSDQNLMLVLENAGMSINHIEYPYLNTPYAEPMRDLVRFIYKILTGKGRFAWPGSMMWIVATKAGN